MCARRTRALSTCGSFEYVAEMWTRATGAVWVATAALAACGDNRANLGNTAGSTALAGSTSAGGAGTGGTFVAPNNGGSAGGAGSGGTMLAGGGSSTLAGVAGVSMDGGAAGESGEGGAPTASAGEAGLAGEGGVPAAGGSGGSQAEAGAGGAGLTVETLLIGDVWSGHPVPFHLLTRGDRQFAAFYDTNRALTIATRRLGESTFSFTRLPSTLGWDSHNSVVMAIDDDGYIHVSGNMHSSPLNYFRSDNPLDIGSFTKMSMVGTNENSCTYPQFYRSPSGELVFIYRSGSSGNGNHIFNAYTLATKSWRRLLASPLTDGEGQRNAYPVGPVQGPDGFFHMVWVWRDTPDAATNHDLSYAKTADLLSWQSAPGAALALPIRLSTGDIVDPVPSGGGMINNNTKIGFDSEKRPIVAYHKFDANGFTQLYNARFENGSWVRYKTSNWTYRWAFGGTGTLIFEIEVEPVELQPDGTLTQNWYHSRYGGLGALRLNPDTLAAEEQIPRPTPYPPELGMVESTTAGMQVRWQADAGEGPDPDVLYMLRWETLPSNNDQPRSTIPPATPLRLYGFRVQR